VLGVLIATALRLLVRAQQQRRGAMQSTR
jgi:hypothetical protein